MYTLKMLGGDGKVFYAIIEPEGRKLALFCNTGRRGISVYEYLGFHNVIRDHCYEPVQLTPGERAAMEEYCAARPFKGGASDG